MNRRSFLKKGGMGAIALPISLNGISFNSIANNAFIKALSAVSAQNRILVVIQLNGGNDGLNMIIPTAAYQHLSRDSGQGGRKSILIPDTSVLNFYSGGVQQYTGTAMHPAMTGVSNLFQQGLLGVVQGVGYPNPSFSHFRATDIVLSGSDSNIYEDTGWVGRYLDHQHPNYAINPPTNPLAITIGAIGSNVYDSSTMNMGIAVQDSQSTGFISGNVDVAPDSLYGYELQHIRNIAQQSSKYSNAIGTAYNNGNNVAQYPSNNPLANQLKTVARLIKGDLNSNFYMVNMGSFDTHDGQVNNGNPLNGWHANLLGMLSEAMLAFQTDLASMSNNLGLLDEQVLGLTISEFGRTIKSNSTFGTDHGTTAPMLLFGKDVAPQILGSNPTVWDSSKNEMKSDLNMQFDFRSIYASILHQWFNLPKTVVDSLFNKSFQDGTQTGQNIYDGMFHCNLPLFKSTFTPIVSGIEDQKRDVVKLFPNPSSGLVQFSNLNTHGDYQILVFSLEGKTLINREFPAPVLLQGIQFDLSKGNYLLKLKGDTKVQEFKLCIE